MLPEQLEKAQALIVLNPGEAVDITIDGVVVSIIVPPALTQAAIQQQLAAMVIDAEDDAAVHKIIGGIISQIVTAVQACDAGGNPRHIDLLNEPRLFGVSFWSKVIQDQMQLARLCGRFVGNYDWPPTSSATDGHASKQADAEASATIQELPPPNTGQKATKSGSRAARSGTA